VSQGFDGVRERARKNKQERFTALLHHVTPGLLRESFYALKRNAAPGVDGVTWEEYATGLEDRLKDLHGRVHRGAYQAQPSKRRWIPKANGKQRPLGIAALEDKIVQQAVVTVLNAIYEEDFRGFSYGFRPGRGQHMALDALDVAIKRKRGNQWRQAARGEITIIRCADDAILGFERQDEAERYLRERKEHLREYGLERNEDKTRLIRFGRLCMPIRTLASTPDAIWGHIQGKNRMQ
jgi:hypothetical protein